MTANDYFISMLGKPTELASVQDFLHSGLEEDDRESDPRTLHLRLLDPSLEIDAGRATVGITRPQCILSTAYGGTHREDSYSGGVFSWSADLKRLSFSFESGPKLAFDLADLLARRNPAHRIEVLGWRLTAKAVAPESSPGPASWFGKPRGPSAASGRSRGSEVFRWIVGPGSAHLVDQGDYVGENFDRFRWIVKNGIKLATPREVPDSECLSQAMSSFYRSGAGRRFLDTIPPSDLHAGSPRPVGYLADLAAIDAEFEAMSVTSPARGRGVSPG